ncbi:MAG: hypothetical protein J6K40_05765 [Alistipes sp.]|nr:hypothetical protein [Alistipes sp.]
MKRLSNKILNFGVALLLAFALVGCGGEEPITPDNPNDNPIDNPNDNTGDENKEPEAPAIIENNGVGEDGKIALDRVMCAYYLGNVWDNGVADYYVMLSNDEYGIGANGFEVPMHQGGWILYLDLWSTMSADTANAVLPEGTYEFGTGRGMGCFYSEFSLASNNFEQVLVDGEWLYDIRDVFFKSGVVDVKHTEKGYLIEGEVTTTDDEVLSFRYEGAIAFEDQSDDEPWQPILDGDVTIVPKKVTMYQYGSYEDENCDNYVVMLFNTTNISADNMHPNEVGGMRLLLDLYPELGKGFVGEYSVGTLTEGKNILEKEPWVYYPGCYWGTMALGTFLEYISEDGSVLYSVVKDGNITITLNPANTYTIAVNVVNEKGNIIFCNWTGTIDNN